MEERVRLRTVLISGLVVILMGCGAPPPPECSSSTICNLSSGGQCIAAPSGRMWCRYPATTCTSGFAWSREAGDELAGKCLEVPDADAALPDAAEIPDAAVLPDAAELPDGPIPEPDAAPMPDAPIPDAAIPDAAMPDATPDAATTGPVNVRVLDFMGVAVLGARVIAQTAAGQIAATGSTNSAGTTTITAPIGGMVTVARTRADYIFLTTVVGVQPGDNLTAVDHDAEVLGGTIVGSLEAKLKGSFSGATDYLLRGSCSLKRTLTNVSDTFSGDLYRDCTSEGSSASAIAVARDAARRSLAFSAGSGSIVSQKAAFMLGSWTAAADLQINVDNSPVASADTSLYATVSSDGVSAATSAQSVSAGVWQVQLPSGGSGYSARVTLTADLGTEGLYTSYSIMSSEIAVPATTLRLDADKLLPKLHGIQFADLGTPRPTISWVLDSGGGGIDGGYILFQWAKVAPNPAIQWVVIIPPSTTVRLPELPSDLGAMVPSATPIVVTVLGDAAASIQSYDDFREAFVPYIRDDGPWARATMFYK